MFELGALWTGKELIIFWSDAERNLDFVNIISLPVFQQFIMTRRATKLLNEAAAF